MEGFLYYKRQRLAQINSSWKHRGFSSSLISGSIVRSGWKSNAALTFPHGLLIFLSVAVLNDLTLLVSNTIQLTQSLHVSPQILEIEDKIVFASSIDGSMVVYYLRTACHNG